jgi:hypothetical protein
LLLAASLKGWSQTDPQRIQFPYLYNGLVSDDDEIFITDFNSKWLAPSPYTDLIKRKHIQTIHVQSRSIYEKKDSEEHLIDNVYFRFTKEGLLDSLIITLSDSLKTFEDIEEWYAFSYRNDSLESIRYQIGYKTTIQNFRILYKDGIPYMTVQDYSGEQLYTKYFPNSEKNTVEIISSKTENFQDTIHPKFFHLTLPDEFFIPEQKKAEVFLKDVPEGKLCVLKDNNGLEISETLYGLNDERYAPRVRWTHTFRWNDNDILETVFSEEDTMYGCTFNEDNLPDTIRTKDQIINISYEYSDEILRWSPCGFKGIGDIDEWVNMVNKNVKTPSYNFMGEADTLINAISDHIVKVKTEDYTYWFRNDYLVQVSTKDGETFRYLKDTLVSYEKTKGNKLPAAKTILKRAYQLRDDIYLYLKSDDPFFGTRIMLLGNEAKVSMHKGDIYYTIYVSRSMVDSLKTIDLNTADSHIEWYNYGPSPESDISHYNNNITQKTIDYIKMSNRIYLFVTASIRKKNLSKTVEFTIKFIDDSIFKNE